MNKKTKSFDEKLLDTLALEFAYQYADALQYADAFQYAKGWKNASRCKQLAGRRTKGICPVSKQTNLERSSMG